MCEYAFLFIANCYKLTSIGSLFEWFSALGLSLNLFKCKVLTFDIGSKLRWCFLIVVIYSSCIGVFDYVSWLKLSCYLDPSPHVEYVCCKAFETPLGFAIRLAEKCQLDMSVQVLYCALIHTIVRAWLCICVVRVPRDTVSDSI